MMKLITYRSAAGPAVAVAEDGRLYPLETLVPGAPRDMLGVIDAGKALLISIRDALASTEAEPLAFDSAEILAPIPLPRRNVMCVGKNYHDHAAEFAKSGFDASSGGQDTPADPIIFTKMPDSVIGPGVPIDSGNDFDGTLDYEGELGVVIGREGRRIAPEDSYDYVYGYTIVNDVTARAAQQRHKQWFIGKSCDTFCPMGPAIVPASDVGQVTELRLVTRVNDEVRQDAVLRDLIFDIPTIIATLSRSMTLKPGDVIATGTPVGVGIGFTPPRFLKPGDRVAISIEPIGTLVNPVS